MKLKLSLMLLLVFGQLSNAYSTVLSPQSMTSAEQIDAKNFLKNEVKADLEANLAERLIEVTADADEKNPLLMGEPLSKETQAVMTQACYKVVKNALAIYGISINAKTFNKHLGNVFNLSSKLGIFPRAFTVGVMGRAAVPVKGKVAVGGQFGTQFNFYLDKGELKVSSYNMYGPQVSAVVNSKSGMQKLEFYASLCFGSCFGGEATGWFVGLDGYASFGFGGKGLFIEGGVDVTDLWKYRNSPEKYSLKDLYKAKAIYIGAGFDVGVGDDVSLNLLKYDLTYEKVLAKPGQKYNEDTLVNAVKF